MRIGIAVRPALPEAEEAAAELKAWLRGRGVEAVDFENVLAGETCDLVMVLGGDGTLLQVANHMAPREIPAIGINYGHVGYLCEIDAGRMREAAELLLAGRYEVQKRTMARATVRRNGRVMRILDALNEILIGGATRTLTLNVDIDGDALGKIRGDGIIVATQTGSTAYAFSAGGSILLLDGFVLVASNAVFSASIRSLIMSTETTIRITDHSFSTTPYVIADGQRDYRMRKEDVVEITASPLRGHLISLGLVSPVHKLSLGFGLRRVEGPTEGPEGPAPAVASPGAGTGGP
jgi:NAD+ kinase